MEMILMLFALPLGDDTPVALFVIIGVVAVALVIGSVVLGILSGKKKK